MKNRILEAAIEALLIILAIIVIAGLGVGTVLVFTWLIPIHVGLAIAFMGAVGFIGTFICILLE